MDTRLVGWLDFAQHARGCAADEVTDQLTGRAVIAATEQESLRLQSLLQLYAGQRAAGEILCRVDTHDNSGVGVALIAGILAHAVGHHTLRLGRGSHDRATGTHAEAVNGATV